MFRNNITQFITEMIYFLNVSPEFVMNMPLGMLEVFDDLIKSYEQQFGFLRGKVSVDESSARKITFTPDNIDALKAFAESYESLAKDPTDAFNNNSNNNKTDSSG